MSNVINDRIDIRISQDMKQLIRYASNLSGFKSLSEFIVFSVNKQANEIISDHNQILKSEEDKKIFLAAILNPAPPNAQLKKAQVRYLKFLESDDATDPGVTKKARKRTF